MRTSKFQTRTLNGCDLYCGFKMQYNLNFEQNFPSRKGPSTTRHIRMKQVRFDQFLPAWLCRYIALIHLGAAKLAESPWGSPGCSRERARGRESERESERERANERARERERERGAAPPVWDQPRRRSYSARHTYTHFCNASTAKRLPNAEFTYQGRHAQPTTRSPKP